MSKLSEQMEKLEYAKGAVAWLLSHAEGLVDMHGIAYWAGVVERLRTEIKNAL
jgi:hypothetical protein